MQDTGTLPIRLSITRGGLGIELSGEVSWGQARVRELSLSLLGVSFPVDLSRGVKQFLSHRTQLEMAWLDLDLPDLAARWSREVSELWGDPPVVRLLPVFSSKASQSALDATPANSEDGLLEGLEVTIASDSGCLVFELLIVSGPEPLLLVDSARSIGEHSFSQDKSALASALICVRAGIRALSSLGFEVDSRGRSLASSRLAQALTLAVLPGLGLRLPRIDHQVISEMRHAHGTLSVRLGRELEPKAASSRVIGLLSMASSLERADSALLEQRSDEARRAYLSALETIPEHPLALLELAELDLVHGDRAEASLSFLEEAENSLSTALPQHRSRLGLLLSRALKQTGRREAARDALSRALSTETNATFFARLSLALAHEVEPAEALELLDRAVSRAPLDAGTRRERMIRLLQSRRQGEAARDAEHLLALESNDTRKGEVCLEIARFYEDAHAESETLAWLQRSLRYCPDLPEAQLRLARALRNGAQPGRALYLLQSSVTQQEKWAQQEGEPGRSQTLAESRLLLAELLFESSEMTAALVQLARIDTRGRLGAAARLSEAQAHQRLERIDQRDRTLLRLVEASELGWVRPEEFLNDLERFARSAAPAVPDRVQELVGRVDRGASS